MEPCEYGLSGQLNGNKCLDPHPQVCQGWKKMGRDGCPKGSQCIYLHQRACPTVENSSLCENRNCLFIHKEISKLTNPPMPSSTGYWDGTQWKVYKLKKGATTWTGVGNPNQSITQINQTQPNWSNWNGVENTNNGVQRP